MNGKIDRKNSEKLLSFHKVADYSRPLWYKVGISSIFKGYQPVYKTYTLWYNKSILGD